MADFAVVRLKEGNLSEAEAIARKIIKRNFEDHQIICRMDSVLEMCCRIRQDFTLSDSMVIKKLEKYNPQANQNELQRLVREHKMDMRILDGQRKYFKNSISNLFRLDTAYARRKTVQEGSMPGSFPLFRLNNASSVAIAVKASGQPAAPQKFRITYTITVNKDAVPAGDTIRCWMPYPREGHLRQQDIRLVRSDPGTAEISPRSDLQRTVYFEKVAAAGLPTVFQTEISFTSCWQYFTIKPETVLPYNKANPLYRENTCERPPQIIFTDKIKSLLYRIIQTETNPVIQVRSIYRWISQHVIWASALEYGIMEDIPGFVLENRHGDCGMQTLLFMTLARCAGIPVKWQSGWMLHPHEVNLHDWCEVYYEGIGWVPLDQSFGLQRSDDPLVRDFYITGIDPYRMIVNDDFARSLTPAKKFMRSEPYDFQRGELEWRGGNLYFDKWDWHMEVSYD